jgi:competence protein ComEA
MLSRLNQGLHAVEHGLWFGAGLVSAAAGSLLLQVLGIPWPASGSPPSASSIRVTALPLRVQVDGAVARPGIYELPPPARVEDAIAAAGGLTEQAAANELNRVARLSDGERIVVPARAGPDEATPTPTRLPRRATPTPSTARPPPHA